MTATWRVPAAVWCFSLALTSAPLMAREKAGIRFEDSVLVGGQTVKLNGLGLRKKFIINVYVGGLYVVTPSKKETDLVAADAPRQLTMHFLRDVDRDKLVGAYRDGFNNNSPKDKVAALKPMIDRFLASIPSVKDGQRIVFTYEPGKGSVLSWPNGKSESFEGKDFADAYLLVFIGRDPPTDDLKDGLLGR